MDPNEQVFDMLLDPSIDVDGDSGEPDPFADPTQLAELDGEDESGVEPGFE